MEQLILGRLGDKKNNVPTTFGAKRYVDFEVKRKIGLKFGSRNRPSFRRV
jgi:hypothetical protein